MLKTMQTYFKKLQDGDNRVQMVTFGVLMVIAILAYLIAR